jgi:tetratricopeptide (TPR) repeat protein
LEALAWQDLQQPARAAQTYRALLSRFPQHYSSAFNLAELLRAQDNIEEAMRAYHTFLQIAPEQERVRRARAQVFLREAESLRAR